MSDRPMAKGPLTPWDIKPEHRHTWAARELRMEEELRAGLPPKHEDARKRHDDWLQHLRETDSVVDYDPDAQDGFLYVKRRPGIDLDLIRVPGAEAPEAAE